MIVRFVVFFVFVCILTGCDILGESVPDGRILIKNDSQDREYNVLKGYGGGVSFALKPGETKLLPGRTTRISFRRDYKDYTRTYEVTCPDNIKRGITIKLLDVHLDRMSGGCQTTSANKF